MASIIVTSGGQAGHFWPLGQRTSVIGRAESVLIQIVDELVSRKHVQIRYDKEQGRHLALDMKSRHGVFINGRRIEAETVLSEGDELLIGRTKLMFTTKDFDDRDSALNYFKKVGERSRPTVIE